MKAMAPLCRGAGLSNKHFLYHHHSNRLTGCRWRVLGQESARGRALTNFTIGCHVLIPSTAIFITNHHHIHFFLFTYASAMAMHAGEGEGMTILHYL